MKTGRIPPDFLGFLVRLSVACAANDPRRMRRELGALRRHPAWTRAAFEAVLEVHLFAGFPATIEGLTALHAAVPRVRGVRSKAVGSPGLRRRGERLCRLIYGHRYGALVRTMERLHPDFSSWILAYGYGTVLARPGLSPALRELVAVAVLAAGGWERQLRSHLQGALNAGASRGEILQAVRTAARLGGLARAMPGLAKTALESAREA